jgi:predicted transcriptional regulator
MTDIKMILGGSLEDDAAAFLAAWHDAERGRVTQERVLAFQSWAGLWNVLTGERYRLLRHVHEHPAASISALARSLKRQYRRVHADVAALQGAGLLERVAGALRTTADKIRAEIPL